MLQHHVQQVQTTCRCSVSWNQTLCAAGSCTWTPGDWRRCPQPLNPLSSRRTESMTTPVSVCSSKLRLQVLVACIVLLLMASHDCTVQAQSVGKSLEVLEIKCLPVAMVESGAGSRVAACSPATDLRDLEWNNVQVLVENGGTLWHDRATYRGAYLVPKEDQVSTVFGGALWTGGISPDQQLKLDAVRCWRNGKFHSTASALLDCTNSWYMNMDRKMFNIVVFLDLKKAFDTVNHDILVRKLELYGITGNALSMIKSYLTDRKQKCQLGDVITSESRVTCGIPQARFLAHSCFSYI